MRPEDQMNRKKEVKLHHRSRWKAAVHIPTLLSEEGGVVGEGHFTFNNSEEFRNFFTETSCSHQGFIMHFFFKKPRRHI